MTTTTMLGLRLPLLLLLFLPLVWTRGFRGIPGNYCRNRKPTECCTGRLDDCAVPIMGSMCYCDQACFTNSHIDCCPDYHEVCLRSHPRLQPRPRPRPRPRPQPRPQPQPPPQVKREPTINRDCVRDGVLIPDQKTHKFNCHQCKCHRGKLMCDEDVCMVEKDLLTKINQGDFTWQAINYTKFWGWRARDGLRLRTGAKSESFGIHPIQMNPPLFEIPNYFDARAKPEWRGMISGIRDQGWCGASWAFSALAVMQDRLSIMSRGQLIKELSPEQLVACSGARLKTPWSLPGARQDSCRAGNYVERAWNKLRQIGVVSEECLPYESGVSRRPSKCLVSRGDTSKLKCQQAELYKTEPAYLISSKVEDIQWEIMTNGPVQAVMRVSPELFVYANGVYTCSAAGERCLTATLHAVRVIGWGQEQTNQPQPLKYWIVANSWGEDWGEGGYFRILRGTDECGIESLVVAVSPRLANGDYRNRNEILG